MSCHANMQCKSTVWTSKKLAAAAAEERRDDSNSIQSNPARGGGGVNRLIIPVHEQIQQQVDHQMAPDLSQVITSWSLSAPSLCVGGYVYASTTVSFFFQRFQRTYAISVQNSDEFHHQFPRLRWILHSSIVEFGTLPLFFSWLVYYCLLACCLACSREKAASSPEEHACTQSVESTKQ